MSEDVIAKFKEAQRQGWKHFAPLETRTTPAAARLVKFANARAGQNVLDVACGTGVVAITAARIGAHVFGIDLTPELLKRAHENARIAKVEIDFREGDVEALPFDDARFDVVLSQFGHMFAPRADVAIAEMLRVLKPGGTIAFATWPPELLSGGIFRLVASYSPPPPGKCLASAAMGRCHHRARTTRLRRKGYFIRPRLYACSCFERAQLSRSG
jgi:SAM-dependent methyltransferase